MFLGFSILFLRLFNWFPVGTRMYTVTVYFFSPYSRIYWLSEECDFISGFSILWPCLIILFFRETGPFSVECGKSIVHTGLKIWEVVSQNLVVVNTIKTIFLEGVWGRNSMRCCRPIPREMCLAILNYPVANLRRRMTFIKTVRNIHKNFHDSPLCPDFWSEYV